MAEKAKITFDVDELDSFLKDFVVMVDNNWELSSRRYIIVGCFFEIVP